MPTIWEHKWHIQQKASTTKKLNYFTVLIDKHVSIWSRRASLSFTLYSLVVFLLYYIFFSCTQSFFHLFISEWCWMFGYCLYIFAIVTIIRCSCNDRQVSKWNRNTWNLDCLMLTLQPIWHTTNMCVLVCVYCVFLVLLTCEQSTTITYLYIYSSVCRVNNGLLMVILEDT